MAVECVNARTILWYVVFVGFAVNYMIRINVNIAVVAMVRPRSVRPGQFQSECFYHANGTENGSLITLNTTDDQAGFPWDEREQGLVLGAFFWLHWITQLPGGMLAQRYGGKYVFGLSQLVGCSLCFLIPAAAYYDLYALLFLRFLQGIIMGIAWPAMHTMTGKWIPPNERSKFVTAYLGSSVGAAVMYPLCGVLIESLGWESVFHVTGAIGVIWFILWHYLVFDTPQAHPRISVKERDYIQNSLGQSSKNVKLDTPWKELLLSKPVWMNIIAQFGGLWGFFTILTQAPTYFKFIHGWDATATGFFSGLPHLFRMGFAYVFSVFGDYLLRNNKMTRTNVRKLATGFCTIGQGLLTIWLAFVGCNATLAVVLITAATALHGAVSTGPLASIVDISPNFAGVSLGVVIAIGAMPGFISPAIIGALTLNNQTIGQWQIVYLISAAMLISSGLIFVLFAESDVQPWDSPKKETERRKTDFLLPNLENRE